MAAGLRFQYFRYPLPDLLLDFPVEFDAGSHEWAGLEFDGVFAEYFDCAAFVLYLCIGFVAGDDNLSGLEVVTEAVV